MTIPNPPIYSLYIHIPFCRRRCSYCDFNTYAGLENLIPAYVTAVCREVEWVALAAGKNLPVHTVFFGGGTPSLLPLLELERILSAVREAFDVQGTAEISLEANPGTLDLASLRGLRALGVNRLSLGMQSAHADELALLGRIHTFQEVVQAVDWARAAGFDNLNLDVIFGMPGQPLERWESTLKQAVGLAPEHLSLYSLTLEEGTPLLGWVQAGQLPEPDPDLAADMYDLATEVLENSGFHQYEISNWARTVGAEGSEVENPSYACRHNLQYWRNRPYIGLGAGAHGYAGNMRIANVLTPAEYIERLGGTFALTNPLFKSGDDEGRVLSTAPFPISPAASQVTPIDEATEIGETMMMGLRLTREGVSQAVFQGRFGRELNQVFAAQIEQLTGLGLLEWASPQRDVLRLTRRGRLLGNQVFVEFI